MVYTRHCVPCARCINYPISCNPTWFSSIPSIHLLFIGCSIPPTRSRGYVNIMHFIKQRAATTGSNQKPQLAQPIRPPSNPSLEPRLSYKGIMLNVPGFVSPLPPNPQVSSQARWHAPPPSSASCRANPSQTTLSLTDPCHRHRLA